MGLLSGALVLTCNRKAEALAVRAVPVAARPQWVITKSLRQRAVVSSCPCKARGTAAAPALHTAQRRPGGPLQLERHTARHILTPPQPAQARMERRQPPPFTIMRWALASCRFYTDSNVKLHMPPQPLFL